MQRLFIFWYFIFTLINLGSAFAANLTIKVIGLIENSGDVHIAIYKGPVNFLETEGIVEQVIMPVSHYEVEWTFSNLKVGRYAVATYHDANGDKKFNQGLFGFPLEMYGFSMKAKPLLSRPEFSEAAFTVPNTGKSIVIDLSQ